MRLLLPASRARASGPMIFADALGGLPEPTNVTLTAGAWSRKAMFKQSPHVRSVGGGASAKPRMWFLP